MSSPRGSRGSATIAVLLSFVWPGLGQAYQRRFLVAAVFAVPMVVLAGYLIVQLATAGARTATLDLFDPGYAQVVLVVGLLAGAWRLASMVEAWLFARRNSAPLRMATGLLVALGLAVVGVHGYAGYLTWAFYDAGSQIFMDPGDQENMFPELDASGDPSTGQSADPSMEPESSDALIESAPPGEVSPSPEPQPASDRISILLIGIDKTPTRTHSLTDTLLVLSVDPATKTAAMLSIPRDVGRFPLYSGGTYTGKINSLLSYAQRHPEAFPDGPTAVLTKEVGKLVGVPVQYYAAVDLTGFVKLVDLVGGVTVDNPRAIDDPSYGGWTDRRPVGFHLPAGRQTLDAQEALAFARSRMGAGDSDFTRARRQQLLLLALQKKLTNPDMLPKLPSILAAAGDAIKTNFPAARLSEVLDLATQVDDKNVKQVVLGPPYSARSSDPSTYMLVPDLARWAKMSVKLFGADSRYYVPPAAVAPSTAP